MRDEDRLVEEILQGERSSFMILLQPYEQGFLNVAYRLTGDRETAREVCQEALLKIFKYLRSFRRGRSFKAWAYRVLVNTAYDFLKETRKQEEAVRAHGKSLLPADSEPEKRLIQREVGEKILASLHGLTRRERAVFLLRDGEGFSVAETAQALGCSRVSVRTHLCRARMKMRERLRKERGMEYRRR